MYFVFIEEAMRRYTEECERAIRECAPQSMVDNTSHIARLANRVLMAAKGEAENSEDHMFVNKVNSAASRLQSTIPPMVNDAKQVALQPRDTNSAGRWRDTNSQVSSCN
jgi:vinculin